jgi:hypothetical protein
MKEYLLYGLRQGETERWTEELLATGSGDPFVANDGGRWFVMQNHDHVDGNGHYGMTTEYLCDPHGYDSAAEAQKAMEGLNQ